MFKEGVAIITLKEKYQKNKKTGEIYYLLTYSLQKTLTKKYFGLIGEKKPTLKDNQKPLFLFSEKRRWASGLHEGEVYLVEYIRQDKYLHVKDCEGYWGISCRLKEVEMFFTSIPSKIYVLSRKNILIIYTICF